MEGITDGEILVESLRQKCIYTSVTQSDQVDKWFTYNVAFLDNCMDKALFGEDCALVQMKKVGINHE